MNILELKIKHTSGEKEAQVGYRNPVVTKKKRV
jgi:hypothetical protein